VAAAGTWALVISPLPAGALVREVGGASFGLQPRNAESFLDGNGEVGAGFNNSLGHPVLHSTRAYAIYWDPTDHYHGDWQNVIDNFLHNASAASGSLASVFAVEAQYTDLSNKPAANSLSFLGAYTDSDAYPSAGCTDPKPLGVKDRITCLSDKQLQEELTSFITQHGLQKGMGSIFYLLTPPGVTVCLDAGTATGHCSDYSGEPGETSYTNSFCSYHSAISPTAPVLGDGNTILYAAIPWIAGGLGDPHLESADQRPAYPCQDGGFDPSSHPIEAREKTHEKNKKEKEEFEAKTKEEKERQEKTEAAEGPHQQEPNQVPCPSPDGGCDTGLADLITNQLAIEQQNIVTDPLLNAWQDSVHNEVTDECRNFFAPVLGGSVGPQEETEAGTLFNQGLGGGHYYLNSAFSLAADRLPYTAIPCLTGVRLVPEFTAPNAANAGEIVGFDGMESVIDLNAAIGYSSGGSEQPNYATYTWSFGDGTANVSGYAPGAPACSSPWLSPCAASVFHSYAYGGTYQVTLTITDVGGDTASLSRSVTVSGPPPPPPAAPVSGSSGAGSSSGGRAGSTTGSTTTPATPPTPGAAAAVSSRSLRNALRKGLRVRYSVSERIAGHFEVLIAASLAHRLKLHGQPASGLAPGTPPQIIIGRAILVTTSGGQNSVSIHFSKTTAQRLQHAGRVTLLLRLIVRNASSRTATVLTTVTLAH
jgi:hypothetical protein